jgi:hypothetical protein
VALAKAPDLESLYLAHSRYLASIVRDGLFLDEPDFTQPVRAILEVVFEFGRAQERLYLALLERNDKSRIDGQRRARNTAAGRWATVDGSEADVLRPISREYEAAVEVGAACPQPAPSLPPHRSARRCARAPTPSP